MFRSSLLRQVSRTSTSSFRQPTFTAATKIPSRSIRVTPPVQDRNDSDNDETSLDHYTTSSELGAHEYEGRNSRTDKTIQIQHPEEDDHPRQGIYQGRGGFHFKRTLASFSLEGRSGVVTGGARGLGLVMSQALVYSGSDVAIVDLNST